MGIPAGVFVSEDKEVKLTWPTAIEDNKEICSIREGRSKPTALGAYFVSQVPF